MFIRQADRKKTYRSRNMTSLKEAIKKGNPKSIFLVPNFMMISIDKGRNTGSLKLCPTAK